MISAGSNKLITNHKAQLAIGLLALTACIALFSGLTGSAQPSAVMNTLWVLLTSGPWAIAWLISAIGLGWPLQRWLTPDTKDSISIQIGLGIGAMLTLDSGLGAIGALQWGGSVGAWSLLAIGIALAIIQLLKTKNIELSCSTSDAWLICVTAPAIALLLLAACSAPGWLWASEFGGYDALSYHLQLPKEWLTLGKIQPLEHNIYSFLPGYVEAAFYHLSVLMDDGVNSAYASQLLHAGFTLLTAFVVGRTASRLGGILAGIIAAALLLGTPWIIVVGSLGYNEMAVALLLACGTNLLLGQYKFTWRHGAALGLLIASACGAKLTAVGFVAAPLITILLLAIPPRRWLPILLSIAFAGTIILMPYLLRNWIYAGNPIFPFAVDLIGSGHWTTDQAHIWNNGHSPQGSISMRLTELFNQLMRYGIGSNPYADEPWRAQWSILPWLAIVCLFILSALKPWLKVALQLTIAILVSLIFWLSFTHIKSRFMLPVAVPATLAAGIAISLLIKYIKQKINASSIQLGLAIAIALWSIQSVLIFKDEGNKAPAQRIGAIDIITGNGLTQTQRNEIAGGSPYITINYLLPENARVLLLGEATPFYYSTNIIYQTTWDRGPLSSIIQSHPNQPIIWATKLRELGFTHILINFTMIQRWDMDNYNDPQINIQSITALANQLIVLSDFENQNLVLYRLP